MISSLLSSKVILRKAHQLHLAERVSLAMLTARCVAHTRGTVAGSDWHVFQSSSVLKKSCQQLAHTSS
jgi:hypothetical protein